MVNRLALAALPADFPAFVREPANAERIAYLSGGPDRWRNTSDLPLKHDNGPDHYMDLEQLEWAGLRPADLPDTRYTFAARFAAAREAHLSAFPTLKPEEMTDRTFEWPGFLPWTIAEYQGRLKSAFSCLRVFEELGTPEEVANARADVVQMMGLMGHYVGDAAQPLHTTIHHNGWTGANPKDYTRWPGFHAWIDGGFVAKSGLREEDLRARVTPAVPFSPKVAEGDSRNPIFVGVLAALLETHRQVEPLYAMEKTGVLKSEHAATSDEGKAFLSERLLAGSRMLSSLWLSARNTAEPDVYLRSRLLQRKAAGTKPLKQP